MTYLLNTLDWYTLNLSQSLIYDSSQIILTFKNLKFIFLLLSILLYHLKTICTFYIVLPIFLFNQYLIPVFYSSEIQVIKPIQSKDTNFVAFPLFPEFQHNEFCYVSILGLIIKGLLNEYIKNC